MRIATVDTGDGPSVAVIQGSEMVLLDEVLPGAPRDVRTLISEWAEWESAISAATHDEADAAWRSHASVRWLPPVIPGKILCVGSNYHDHVEEMTGPAGLENRPSPFPFSFLKPSTSLVGSGQRVAMPPYGYKLDWEAELAVVIGDPSYASGPDPLRAVFGYTLLNDLSLRDFIPFPHTLGIDVVVSKGFDGAAPIGPWITLAEDVPDAQDLRVQLSINGEMQQDGTTASMIFGIAELIAHYARVLSLEPGDVIATGTPAGVGAARKPPRFLVEGDEVEISIGDLGSLRTSIVAGAEKNLLALG